MRENHASLRKTMGSPAKVDPTLSWPQLQKALRDAVTQEEALSPGLSPGLPMYRLHGIRYADEVPLA